MTRVSGVRAGRKHRCGFGPSNNRTLSFALRRSTVTSARLTRSLPGRFRLLELPGERFEGLHALPARGLRLDHLVVGTGRNDSSLVESGDPVLPLDGPEVALGGEAVLHGIPHG